MAFPMGYGKGTASAVPSRSFRSGLQPLGLAFPLDAITSAQKWTAALSGWSREIRCPCGTA